MGIQLVQQPRPMVTKPSGWRTAAGLAALGKKLIGQYKQKMLQQEIQDVMRQSDDMAGFTQGMGDIYGRMNEDRGFFGSIGDQFNPGTLRGTEMDPQTEKMMMNALMSKLGRSDELADEKRQDERRMELERTMKAEGLGVYRPSGTTTGKTGTGTYEKRAKMFYDKADKLELEKEALATAFVPLNEIESSALDILTLKDFRDVNKRTRSAKEAKIRKIDSSIMNLRRKGDAEMEKAGKVKGGGAEKEASGGAPVGDVGSAGATLKQAYWDKKVTEEEFNYAMAIISRDPSKLEEVMAKLGLE